VPPNGVRYRRLEREKLGNGKLLKFRTSSKKRADSQPSGARFVGRFQVVQDSQPKWKNSMMNKILTLL